MYRLFVFTFLNVLGAMNGVYIKLSFWWGYFEKWLEFSSKYFFFALFYCVGQKYPWHNLLYFCLNFRYKELTLFTFIYMRIIALTFVAVITTFHKPINQLLDGWSILNEVIGDMSLSYHLTTHDRNIYSHTMKQTSSWYGGRPLMVGVLVWSHCTHL